MSALRRDRGRAHDFHWGVILAASLVWSACTAKTEAPGAGAPAEAGEPACSDRNPQRNLYFGDLHVHTGFSFDAQAYGNHLSPADSYAFAAGSPVYLPPLGGDGMGTREVRIDRPLDFLAVTDHGELLGEIRQCTVPGSPGYDSVICSDYRDPERNGAYQMGLMMGLPSPSRVADLCGDDGRGCRTFALERWLAMQQAAEDAYDRSESCSMTTFVAYEYTNTRDISNLHRNVIFRSAVVPELPITYFEAPSPESLWQQLDEACPGGDADCDVLVIPHNSNLSNGKLFTTRGLLAPEAPAGLAELRARMEPLVEVFQHKGDSECRNGVNGDGVPWDPLCDFEKLRPPDAEVCGEEPGSGGMRLWGCVHRLDFVRNVLKEGLEFEQSHGVNPYRLGLIGSTDTHNGTPGHVAERSFPGHVGSVDASAEGRLGSGNVTHDGVINNPGGLAAVWAVENSREAIFDSLRRREVYATSGPRMRVRSFGGWKLPEDLCEDPQRAISRLDPLASPMGGVFPPRVPGSVAAELWVWAERDPGFSGQLGAPLQRLQIVKGWLDSEGKAQERVYEVAGELAPELALDPSSCEPETGGVDSLCVRWIDPDFDPEQAAFYYARVLEVPTCRWSTRECNRMPGELRPAACSDGSVTPTVQERAWTSPIWYEPSAQSR